MWGETTHGGSGKCRLFYEELSKEQVHDLCNLMEQAQQPNCLSNYNVHSGGTETRQVVLPGMDAQMLYTGSLHSCTEQMSEVINEALLALEYNITMPVEVPSVRIPQRPQEPRAAAKHPLNFAEKVHSEFSRGVGEAPATLADATRRQVEDRCIATMLSHVGFRSADGAVVGVLTDVLEAFLRNVCGELRVASDSLLTGGCSNFPDAVEQVLVQAGVGGVAGVCDYYERRVRRYGRLVERRGRAAAATYARLCGRLLEQGEQKIPELHFATIDSEKLQAFTAGFEMLQSLEQSEQSAPPAPAAAPVPPK